MPETKWQRELPLTGRVFALIVLLGALAGQSAVTWAQRAEELEVPVCLMTPVYVDTGPYVPSHDEVPRWVALRWSQAALLALEHINSRNCEVVGAGCEDWLRSSDGVELILKPHISQLRSLAASDAPSATHVCISTESQLLMGVTTSKQSHLVASFVSGIGRLLLSSLAEAPKVQGEIEGSSFNFVRTAPSATASLIAISELSVKLGWKQITVLHTHDVEGDIHVPVLLKEVLDSTGRAEDLAMLSIDIDDGDTDDVNAAMRELRQSGSKVVCLLAFESDIMRILAAARQAIEDAGEKYSSFTWIIGSAGTEGAELLSSSPSFSHDSSLLEGALGVQVALPIEPISQLQRSLQEMNATAESFLATMEKYLVYPPGSGHHNMANSAAAMNHTLVMEALQYGNSVIIDKYTAHTYDAVWSMAVAAASALRDSNGTVEVPTGSEVMKRIVDMKVTRFNGAGGVREFLPSGDWDISHTRVEITNYGRRGAESEARHVVVGWLDVNDSEVMLSETEHIVWANGEEYPFVPTDGSSSSSDVLLPAILGSLLSVLVLMVLVIAALLLRNRFLNKRVLHLVTEAKSDVDMESPLGKVMQFLERYQSCSWWQRPNVAEASELQDTIVSRAHKLMVPDLEEGLSEYSGELKSFLLNSLTERPALRGSAGSAFYHDVSSRSLNVIVESEANSDLDTLLSPTSPLSCEGAPSQDVALLFPTNSEGAGGVEETSDSLTMLEIGRNFFVDAVTQFSPLRNRPNPLCIVVERSVGSLKLIKQENAVKKLLDFTQLVEGGYKDIGYHCKCHAADVTNRMVTIAVRMGIAGQKSVGVNRRNQVPYALAALVAATVHDYGHPQVNNSYLVSNEDDMALDFNNQAVAENYSLREAMRAMLKPEFNFIDAMYSNPKNATQRRQWFRHTVINIVLATDMSRHYELLSQFNIQIVNNPAFKFLATREKWLKMSDAQRLLSLQIALKVADLGHCALPMDQHREWISLLETEFFAQGDLERDAGMKISPLMDREQQGPQHPETQVGFFEVIVIPLFTSFVEAFPDCSPLMEQATANLEYWKWAASSHDRKNRKIVSSMSTKSPEEMNSAMRNSGTGLPPAPGASRRGPVPRRPSESKLLGSNKRYTDPL